MVLAGPGSGKTSVIVERTAYMTGEGKIPGSSVLVVTFSRSAAREMKERFLKFTRQASTDVTFGTFHGVFYGILKHAYGLGAGNILSEEEKYAILKEMTLEYGQELTQEGDFQEDVAKEISVVKGNRIALDHYYSSCCPDDVFRQIYTGYQKTLRERRKLDFDDMLLCCYQLFDRRKDILAAWQNKFQYIMVDEFQDINHLQYDIVRMLAKPRDNLFIVGDDDQSIYHFRGAKPEIMHAGRGGSKEAVLIHRADVAGDLPGEGFWIRLQGDVVVGGGGGQLGGGAGGGIQRGERGAAAVPDHHVRGILDGVDGGRAFSAAAGGGDGDLTAPFRGGEDIAVQLPVGGLQVVVIVLVHGDVVGVYGGGGDLYLAARQNVGVVRLDVEVAQFAGGLIGGHQAHWVLLHLKASLKPLVLQFLRLFQLLNLFRTQLQASFQLVSRFRHLTQHH